MSYKIDIVNPYERVYQEERSKSKIKGTGFLFNIGIQDVLLILIGFFLSRGTIMHSISPFGFPFMTYTLARRKKNWIALAILPGLMTVQSTLYVIRAGLTMACLYWILDRWTHDQTKGWKTALLSSLTLFVVGSAFQFIKGNYIFDFILLIFESLVAYILYFIYSTAIPLLLSNIKRKVVSNEELICGAILISLTLLGMDGLSIYGYSLKNVLGIAIILLFARYLGSGAGATIGIVVGVVTSLTELVTPAIIGVYAFSGLLAGIFKDMGKFLVGVGFILGNAALTFYINGSTEVFIHIQEILIGMGITFFIPTKVEDRVSSFSGIADYRAKRERMYGDRVRDVTIDRLRGYAKIFEQIGKSFEQASVSEALSSKNELDGILEGLNRDVCSKCSFCSKCWERGFYHTYQNMYLLLDKIEKNNAIQQEDLDQLTKGCLHPDRVAQELICLFKIYRINKYWKRQVHESRNLVSQQLKGISGVIRDLGEDMGKDILFRKNEEEDILIALDQNAIPIKDVMVIGDGEGRYEVTVYGEACGGKDTCHREMEGILTQVLGRRMVKDIHHCYEEGDEGKCRATFKEALTYRVHVGMARAPKNAQEESGDSYSSGSLNDGKYMLALSDGMGSGKRAARESRTTIHLLEEFLEAGFNRDIALKTINSILMLRSSDEMFSTIDLSIIDLYDGWVEFIKIGAVSTFIKRKDGVEVIPSHSLPVGILDEVNVDFTKRQLEDGDMIVMMTDGLLESNPFREDKEKWIIEELVGLKSRNPQRIAKHLLDQARHLNQGQFKDDTSILVAKIYKEPYNE